MIGAHDTFTYLNCEDSVLNLFKKYWKCQTYSPTVLYNTYKVRFFDIRICKNTIASPLGVIGKLFKKKKFTWAVSHGLAEFKTTFNNVEDIFKYMKTNFPLAQYRIVLERCSSEEKNQFNSQISSWISNNGKKLKNNGYKCSWIGIKNPWQCKYIDNSLFPQHTKDYCCRLFNWDTTKSLSQNIKNFKADYTIESWAKANNPNISYEQLNDQTTLYFMDYVGKYGTIQTVKGILRNTLLGRITGGGRR